MTKRPKEKAPPRRLSASIEATSTPGPKAKKKATAPARAGAGDGEKAPSATPAGEQDIVLLHSPTEDGEGVNAIRARPDRVEFAEIRPVKDGEPIVSGEIVKLKPRDEEPRVCDVEVIHRTPVARQTADHEGPARVASDRYRRNWDKVFGRRPKRSELN